nr:hypothetical protein [Pandoravirus massiliensis]
MSADLNESSYDHIIQALQKLGDNAAAVALISVFEEQRRCMEQQRAAQEPAAPAPVSLIAPEPKMLHYRHSVKSQEPTTTAQAEAAASVQTDTEARDTRTQEPHAVAISISNPAHIHIDTVNEAPAQDDNDEKPGKAGLIQQDSVAVVQAQQMPSNASLVSSQSTSAVSSRRVDAAPPAVAGTASNANGYVTLAQFVAFLSTMPADSLIRKAGLIRVATIEFDVKGVTDDAVTFGHTIEASHTYDIDAEPIALKRRDFNAISLDGNTVTAGRLRHALEPLVAINPSAGVCVNDTAIKLEGAFSFATDNAVRFHRTSLNPAYIPANRDAIRDAIAFATRCMESGISCGEVLSMLARRIPQHARMGVLHLVALNDRVVTGKQIGVLFQSCSVAYNDVPADLFGEVEPTGECPPGFKRSHHISMGRLPVTWDELEDTIIDGDGDLSDLEDLPRYAGSRPWTLPLF